MLMLADEVQHATLLLEKIKKYIAAEDYSQATALLSDWQLLLRQIFSQLKPNDGQLLQQLEQLNVDFLALLPALQQEQAKIKHSISQIAAIKSENKIRRTYQIE